MKLNRSELKLRRMLFQQLPYYNIDIVFNHGKFNNLTDNELSSKFSLSNLPSLCDLNLFALNSAQNYGINPDVNLDFNAIRSNYYSPHSFSQIKRKIDNPHVLFPSFTITYEVYNEILKISRLTY